MEWCSGFARAGDERRTNAVFTGIGVLESDPVTESARVHRYYPRPLRMDDTHKSRRVHNRYYPRVTRTNREEYTGTTQVSRTCR